jgi:hypothetical protein
LAGNWRIVFQLVNGKLVYSQSVGTSHICGREEEISLWDI